MCSTWAPIGKPPVLEHNGGHQRFSAVGYAAYRPIKVDGSGNPEKPDLADEERARFVFGLTPDSYKTPTFCKTLTALHDELGAGVTLILDKAQIHRSDITREFIKSLDWLTVLYLPGYSPDLQPVEGTWSSAKRRNHANRCAKNLGELEQAARAGFERVRDDPQLLLGCLKRTGLTLDVENFDA